MLILEHLPGFTDGTTKASIGISDSPWLLQNPTSIEHEAEVIVTELQPTAVV